MIKRKENLTTVSKNIKDGNGEILVTDLLQPEEFCGKGRVFVKQIIQPGNSIGRHTHVGDFEVYYILKGEATFYDNGEAKKVYAGDVCLTKDGENHELVNDSNEELELIALILYS